MRWTWFLIYAIALGTAAFLLTWLQVGYLLRRFPADVYTVLIAVSFAGLGVWFGQRWRSQSESPPPLPEPRAAPREFGISEREFAVLELLASGQTNKEIARSLAVSPNTVKTHVARLYAKLDAGRRTEAIHRARELGLLL
ncbi:MAG: response regulator transcription factor [Pseudomonadota bacterium]